MRKRFFQMRICSRKRYENTAILTTAGMNFWKWQSLNSVFLQGLMIEYLKCQGQLQTSKSPMKSNLNIFLRQFNIGVWTGRCGCEVECWKGKVIYSIGLIDFAYIWIILKIVCNNTNNQRYSNKIIEFYFFKIKNYNCIL